MGPSGMERLPMDLRATTTSSRWHGLAVLLDGESAYRPAWRLQQRLWEMRIGLRLPDTLLLLQHQPVLTLGRHGRETNVLPQCGLEVVRIDRGGDVTYHGPGQVTGYFICDLHAHDLSVRAFVARLEETIVRTLGEMGIVGERREGLTGVWVRDGTEGEVPVSGPGSLRSAPSLRGARGQPSPGGDGRLPSWAKIAALGVRIARGVSRHGIALNVCGPLPGFAAIVPCGLAGESVTSIERVLGARGAEGPGVEEVARALRRSFATVFGVEFRETRSGPVTGDDDADRLLSRLQVEAMRGARKPAWLRTHLPGGSRFTRVRQALRQGRLHTVCESARCPNCHECWNQGTATFLILGDACTRGCRFCAIRREKGAPPDPGEPEAVARAATELGLRHVVATSVTRDDLPDGGAAQFVATIRAVRAHLPETTVEVLIPDFGGERAALDRVLHERPDVLNHNVETVPRLYPRVRPGADFARSLAILQHASESGLRTKSGFMVGLGESEREVRELLRELRQVGCRHVTIGQYLTPTRENLPVQRYFAPQEFAAWAALARQLGFEQAAAGPLVRSSYHAAAGLSEVDPVIHSPENG